MDFDGWILLVGCCWVDNPGWILLPDPDIHRTIILLQQVVEIKCKFADYSNQIRPL